MKRLFVFVRSEYFPVSIEYSPEPDPYTDPFLAICEDPRVVTQGMTIDEAAANIMEAIEVALDDEETS